MHKRDTFQERALCGQPIDDCLIIDAHGHLGDNLCFPLFNSGVETVITIMNQLGIDIFCPSAYWGLNGFAHKGNDLVIEAIRLYPKRIFGYMTVDIADRDSIIPELERCLNAGLKAIKICDASPGYMKYNHANYITLYEFANYNELPILAHTWGKELADFEPLYDKYPNVNFILAHAGVPPRDVYARHASEYANVYLDPCNSGAHRGMHEYFVGKKLEDKIIFGTDMTFLCAKQQIGRVIFADLSEQVKSKILGENAVKALRLDMHLWETRTHVSGGDNGGEK